MERLARLEERVKNIDTLLRALVKDVHTLMERSDNRRGFMAGVTATVSLVWILIGTVLSFWYTSWHG